MLNYRGHVPSPEIKDFIIREKLRCDELKIRGPSENNTIQLLQCQKTIDTLEQIYPILNYL